MWCIDIHSGAGADVASTRSGTEVPHDIVVPPRFLCGAGPARKCRAYGGRDLPRRRDSRQEFAAVRGKSVSVMLVPIAGRAAKLDYQLLSGVPLLASDIRGFKYYADTPSSAIVHSFISNY